MDPAKINIVLGSGSPRRLQLLTGIGLHPNVMVSNAEEIYPDSLQGGDIALFVAKTKAEALKDKLQESDVLITADTIVSLDNMILNKPGNKAEAVSMLKSLSGRSHEVYTGVCILSGDRNINFVVRSTVQFLNLSDPLIETYIDRYKPFDKAGSYGAQECLTEGTDPCSKEEREFLIKYGWVDLYNNSLSVRAGGHVPMIASVTGSYFNVMGLPLVELYNALLKL